MRAKTFRTIKNLSRPLTNGAVVEKGELAALDTSTALFVAAGTSTTLVPCGYFMEDITGDGTTETQVELFQPIRVEFWDNDDAPNDVAESDIGSECYVKDGSTVSMLSTGRSKAGRVWVVDAVLGVGVQSGVAVTGPTGASGSGAAGNVATKTALKAVAAGSRADGDLVMVLADDSLWRFDDDSEIDTDVAEELVLVPDVGDGRWLRADKSFVAKIPVAFGMDDGALIWTIPAGLVVRLTGLPFWEVTTAFSGGSSSRIGIASDITGYDTAGDILGGSAGEVNATLAATGIKPGTIGPKLDTPAEVQAFVMVEGDSLTYEEITSAYTAGAGFVCVPVAVMHAA